MSDPVSAYLNSLPAIKARAELGRCCGARRWVDAMIEARPFPGDTELFAVAERVWWGLRRADWLEAFAAHPRIGGSTSTEWTRREQGGVDGAQAATLLALARQNAAYEQRFGHVFLICATGKTADAMLDALRHRLTNDPTTELRIAAAEQAKITRLRLDKLAAP